MAVENTAGTTAPLHSFGAPAVAHLLEALGRLGVRTPAVCREAGISSDALADPRRRVGARQLLTLFAAAERRTGDPLVGLHVAEHVRFGSLPVYLVGTQNTVADALTMQDRMLVLILGATAVAVRDAGGAAQVVLDVGSPADERRHLTEYCIASACRLLRWLTLRGVGPTEVHFRHGSAGRAAEYERVFACPVRFHMCSNGALLSRATLREPLVSANPLLAGYLERLARADIAPSAAAAFRDAVVCALRAARLDAQNSRREVVARRLGVSARTLQRRLAAEGTSFAAVLDETRRHAALDLIGDRALSIAEVSSGVGYADQFAFNKAFRRWTGRSPSAYRQERLDDGSRRGGHSAADTLAGR
jgi:AraC-like DNA-binding protein